MDKVDNPVIQETWPPDSALAIMGMTRLEWNTMSEAIARKDLPMIEAIAKGIAQRKMDGLGKAQRAQA